MGRKVATGNYNDSPCSQGLSTVFEGYSNKHSFIYCYLVYS